MGDVIYSKQILKLFQELKDSSLPEENDSLDDLISKKDIYDINQNPNYTILDKSIQLSLENLLQNLYYNNQILTNLLSKTRYYRKIKFTEKGKKINKRIVLTKESFMEKYFNILNELKIFLKDKSLKKYRKIKE